MPRRVRTNRILFATICVLFLGILFIFINQFRGLLGDRQFISSPKPMKRSFPCPQNNMVILAIDGGGSRGVIPLAFLEQLESVSEQNTAELFDLMSGVSTGTIITTALAVGTDEGNAKYSAKTLLSLYEHDAKIIFNESVWHKLKTLWGLEGPWLNDNGKNEILSSYFGSLILGDLRSNVVIFSYDLLHEKIRMFCSWSVCDALSNSYFIRCAPWKAEGRGA